MKKLLTIAAATLCMIINSSAGSKPNIVVINVDDLGWNDVQYMQETKSPYHSPNIEKLASQSMVFTNGYAACPVCSPSRAAIVTGKTTARLKMTAHIAGNPPFVARKNPKNAKLLPAVYKNQLDLEEVTFAEVLKKNGYRTGFIGKWHLAGEGSQLKPKLGGNIAPQFHPEHQGFDINIGGCAYGSPKGSYFDPYNMKTLKDRKKGEYLTDRLTDEAINFISESQEKPFLLYLNPYSVHTPIQAPKERVQLLKKIAPNKKSNKYAAMVYSVDLMIGKITDHLDKLKLTGNTLLIFTSDNGGIFGNRPLRDNKGTLYEGGIRVPFIIRWPGKIKAGSVSQTPVIGYDIFPTLLDAAGVADQAPADIDGISILPAAKGGAIKRQQPLLWHYPHYHHGGMKSLDMGCAVRDGDWKYVYIYKTGKSFLFNLKKDPKEKKNLIASQPERASQFKKKMDAMLKEMNANMPIQAK